MEMLLIPAGMLVIASRASPGKNSPHFSALDPSITPPTRTRPRLPFPTLYSIKSSPKPPTRDIGIFTVLTESSRSASSIPLEEPIPCPNLMTLHLAAMSSIDKSTSGFAAASKDKERIVFEERPLEDVEGNTFVKESQRERHTIKIAAAFAIEDFCQSENMVMIYSSKVAIAYTRLMQHLKSMSPIFSGVHKTPSVWNKRHT